jgi:hypothetical protein
MARPTRGNADSSTDARRSRRGAVGTVMHSRRPDIVPTGGNLPPLPMTGRHPLDCGPQGCRPMPAQIAPTIVHAQRLRPAYRRHVVSDVSVRHSPPTPPPQRSALAHRKTLRAAGAVQLNCPQELSHFRRQQNAHSSTRFDKRAHSKHLDDGRSEIRTHESLSAPHAFQACALNHSATRPNALQLNHRAPAFAPVSRPWKLSAGQVFLGGPMGVAGA